MAHYAKIINNKVTQIIVIEDDKINLLPNVSSWVKCSYNTRGGAHFDPNTGEITSGSKALRYNFPSIGDNYDPVADAFYSDSPFPSWVLNTGSYTWEPPIGWPTEEWNKIGGDVGDQSYQWNEDSQSWDLVIE